MVWRSDRRILLGLVLLGTLGQLGSRWLAVASTTHLFHRLERAEYGDLAALERAVEAPWSAQVFDPSVRPQCARLDALSNGVVWSLARSTGAGGRPGRHCYSRTRGPAANAVPNPRSKLQIGGVPGLVYPHGLRSDRRVDARVSARRCGGRWRTQQHPPIYPPLPDGVRSAGAGALHADAHRAKGWTRGTAGGGRPRTGADGRPTQPCWAVSL